MAKQGNGRAGKSNGKFALPKDSFGDTIVHLNRLTSREVGDWMDAGNDTIFVPHGPISGHGPWTTLGIHPHCAEAVALLLARKCNGVVYPPIYTCFCGATRMYPGSVQIGRAHV
jgi:creatinine amidohydrolase/Fe(II)-dependent formamide hydrolase-like protein